jgi:hypothetical protein
MSVELRGRFITNVTDRVNWRQEDQGGCREYLEVAEITVRRWARSRRLKARKLGRNLVFDVDEIQDL